MDLELGLGDSGIKDEVQSAELSLRGQLVLLGAQKAQVFRLNNEADD